MLKRVRSYAARKVLVRDIALVKISMTLVCMLSSAKDHGVRNIPLYTCSSPFGSIATGKIGHRSPLAEQNRPPGRPSALSSDKQLQQHASLQC